VRQRQAFFSDQRLEKGLPLPFARIRGKTLLLFAESLKIGHVFCAAAGLLVSPPRRQAAKGLWTALREIDSGVIPHGQESLAAMD